MVQRRIGVRLRCPGRLGGFECRPVRRIEAGTEGALEGQLIAPRLRQPYDRQTKTHLEDRWEGYRLYGDYRRFLSPRSWCFEPALEKDGAETSRQRENQNTQREIATRLIIPTPDSSGTRLTQSCPLAWFH